MADLVDQLGDLAIRYAEVKGARVSLRLNAWPGEIQIADAKDLQSSGPGLIQGQVIVRDSAGRTMTTIGSDVRQNWLLTGAVVAGLALVAFVLMRGIFAPGKGR